MAFVLKEFVQTQCFATEMREGDQKAHTRQHQEDSQPSPTSNAATLRTSTWPISTKPQGISKQLDEALFTPIPSFLTILNYSRDQFAALNCFLLPFTNPRSNVFWKALNAHSWEMPHLTTFTLVSSSFPPLLGENSVLHLKRWLNRSFSATAVGPPAAHDYRCIYTASVLEETSIRKPISNTLLSWQDQQGKNSQARQLSSKHLEFALFNTFALMRGYL